MAQYDFSSLLDFIGNTRFAQSRSESNLSEIEGNQRQRVEDEIEARQIRDKKLGKGPIQGTVQVQEKETREDLTATQQYKTDIEAERRTQLSTQQAQADARASVEGERAALQFQAATESRDFKLAELGHSQKILNQQTSSAIQQQNLIKDRAGTQVSEAVREGRLLTTQATDQAGIRQDEVDLKKFQNKVETDQLNIQQGLISDLNANLKLQKAALSENIASVDLVFEQDRKAAAARAAYYGFSRGVLRSTAGLSIAQKQSRNLMKNFYASSGSVGYGDVAQERLKLTDSLIRLSTNEYINKIELDRKAQLSYMQKQGIERQALQIDAQIMRNNATSQKLKLDKDYREKYKGFLNDQSEYIRKNLGTQRGRINLATQKVRSAASYTTRRADAVISDLQKTKTLKEGQIRTKEGKVQKDYVVSQKAERIAKTAIDNTKQFTKDNAQQRFDEFLTNSNFRLNKEIRSLQNQQSLNAAKRYWAVEDYSYTKTKIKDQERRDKVTADTLKRKRKDLIKELENTIKAGRWKAGIIGGTPSYIGGRTVYGGGSSPTGHGT